MEGFLIVVLCIAVGVLIARLAARGGQIERLTESLQSVERRLSRVEAEVRRPAPPVAVERPVQAGGPFYAAAVDPSAKIQTPPVLSDELLRTAASASLAGAVPAQAYRQRAVGEADSQGNDSKKSESLATYSAPAPTFAAASASVPASAALPAFVPVPTSAAVPAHAAAPAFDAAPAPEPEPFVIERKVSLEERLGQNWLNKLGIVTLVIGIASFLGYKLQTLGPAGKSATGMVLALALLGGGLLLERRAQYRLFARAAIGGGWALTFFVTFALYHVAAMQVLPSQALDLVLMMIVAGAMVAHSLRYRSQVVTSLAFLLAFVTVGISEVTLFSLVAGLVLACGLIFVAARACWFELALAGLVGVYLNHFLWLHRVLPDGGQVGQPFAELVPSAALLVVYWLLFRLFYVLRVPATRRQEVVGSLTAVLNVAGLMALLKYQSSHPEWAFWGLLALGVTEMALAFVARRRYRTGFVVLSSVASLLLLAAVPFRFSGSRWGGLWLLQAEMLFVVGVRLREVVFRRVGIVATFAASAVLVVSRVVPIFWLRLNADDTARHLSVTVMLASVALVLWLNAEFAMRHWPSVVEHASEAVALAAGSYVAAGVAMLALWVCFPGDWTVVAWLGAALALGWIADRVDADALALQTDALAVGAVLRIAAVNLHSMVRWGGFSLRSITVLLAAALLYAGMRRKRLPVFATVNYVPAAYSWAASLLLGALALCALRAELVAVAWALLGWVLLELGLAVRRDFLRWQGLTLLAASFVRLFFVDLDAETITHGVTTRVLTVVPLIVAYFWVYARLGGKAATVVERRLAAGAAWAGVAAAAALVCCEARPQWVAIAWALMVLVLIAAAWLLRRTVLLEQSLLLAGAVAVRVLTFNLWIDNGLPAMNVDSRVVCTGAACAALLLGLPFAFRIRALSTETQRDGWRRYTVFRPEQPLFFVPLLLLTVLLAVQLRAGMITIAWSALGVAVFLFALAVKERSYRLAGLLLLLLGVAKILLVDVWNANPSERYLTLIVMGAALLLVSFLYSRYKETLLKFL